jgi:LmbE family N-acetylglucosaminyl deacetylase
VKVTKSEFKRLTAEKEKLQVKIKESQNAQNKAMRIHKKALEDLQVAQAQEERLRTQMDLLDRRAEEAIAVKEQSIKEQEQVEVGYLDLKGPLEGPGVLLSPST